MDFYEIRFVTTQRTNFQTIQSTIGPDFNKLMNRDEQRTLGVRVLDAEEGGSASIFAVRLQDPTPQRVEAAFHILQNRLQLVGEPTFSAVEIALDLKRRAGTTDEQLAAATVNLYRFSASRPSANCRAYNGRETMEAPTRITELQRLVMGGYCLAVGSQSDHTGKRGTLKADPVSMRAYFKRTDDGLDLPANQHSARIEFTLQGDAMPFRTLQELAAFDFATLAPLFSFRRLKDDLSPFAEIHRTHAFDLSKKTRNRRGGGTREHHPATVSDVRLNKLARRALERLTESWQEIKACGNKPFFHLIVPVFTRVPASNSNNYYYNNINNTSNNTYNNKDTNNTSSNNLPSTSVPSLSSTLSDEAVVEALMSLQDSDEAEVQKSGAATSTPTLYRYRNPTFNLHFNPTFYEKVKEALLHFSHRQVSLRSRHLEKLFTLYAGQPP